MIGLPPAGNRHGLPCVRSGNATSGTPARITAIVPAPVPESTLP